MPWLTRRWNLTLFLRSQASCFSQASRFGMVIAMWLIATGSPNISQSFGGGGRLGFSTRAMSWWFIAPLWAPESNRIGRRLDVPTSLKPRISVQNLCDSSMLRTLMTRWLMPPGVTASSGAVGTTWEVPSAIVLLRDQEWCSYREYKARGAALPEGSRC